MSGHDHHDHHEHGHDHAHHDCGHDHHDHEGHVHVHDIYSEDGVSPTVVSVTREIAQDQFAAEELARRAERIAYTLTSVFTAKKILIGHIKLQVLAGENDGLFVSATSLKNITVTVSEGFVREKPETEEPYSLGLTAIVFGMNENHAASLVSGITDGLLNSPV